MSHEDAIEMPDHIVGGSLSLDFANSVDNRGLPSARDFVVDLPSFRAWCRRVGIAVAMDAKDASIIEVHQLRDAVLSVCSAAALRLAPNTEDLDLVNAYNLPRRLIWSGSAFCLEADAVEGSLRAALSEIARDTIDLLTGARRNQLKACDRPGHCDWLFLDTTKNHSRRFCTEGCAMTERVHRHRKK